MTKKDGNTQKDNFILTPEEVDAFKTRIGTSQLPELDQKLVLSLLSTVLILKELVERRKSGLLSLLRKLFGLKTEKKNQTRKSSKKNKTGNGNPKGKGHGRNGADQYPGAKKVFCKHDELEPGDQCPACGKGNLREEKPAVHQHWIGNSPLQLILYVRAITLFHGKIIS